MHPRARVRTVAAANHYLRQRFIPDYNRRFTRPPRDPATAFVPAPGLDLDQVLCHEAERVVGQDNVVQFERVKLQLQQQRGRRSCAGMRVVARRHVDGTHTVWRGAELLGRYDAKGRPLDSTEQIAA